MKNLTNKIRLIIGLQNEGYYNDFRLSNETLQCIQNGSILNADDFEVERVHFLALGLKNESAVVIYAIASTLDGSTGILMIPYSVFTKGISIHLWSKLSAKLTIKDSPKRRATKRHKINHSKKAVGFYQSILHSTGQKLLS
ncbi:hypothetical protein [Pedobacter jamesrossensis]|uniref:Uncharacterized protein n=1 Tax=Pedobacter jamesrossensis TaxID=1908238 RepID=A0ABV8NJB5_9SPHI